MPSTITELEIVDGGGSGRKASVETNNALAVNVQDQTSQVIDLYLSKVLQSATVTTNTSLDDTTITITTAGTPVVGSILCLKESQSFYQGIILSVVANSTNWDVTLDTPIDFAFTTSANASERTRDMNVDGSSTSQTFIVSPVNLASGTKWDIVRVTFAMLDSSSMDDGKFGGLTALTNGMLLRVKNGITKNIFNVKTNSELAIETFDLAYADNAPGGQYGLRCRRTFGGQSKNGVTIRLEADTSDELQIIIQDDLTGLDDFRCVAQGHVVTD